MSKATLIAALGISLGLALVLSPVHAVAQFLGAIREKVDQLDEKLKALEAAQKRDIQRLQSQIAKTAARPGTADGDSALSALQTQVGRLREDLGRLQGTVQAPGERKDAGLRVSMDTLRALADSMAAHLDRTRGEGMPDRGAGLQDLRTLVDGLRADLGKWTKSYAGDGKLSGYAFGDYYYIGSASGLPNGVASPSAQRQNAFQIRRIYFQYDRKLDDRFSTRFRLEMNDPGFGKTDRLVPYVKGAHLKFAHAPSGTGVSAGLISALVWENAEAVWGYRPVERTLLDLQASAGKARAGAADFGLSVQGRLDRSGKWGYWLMAGNGTGLRPENDNGKKLYGQLQAKPGNGLVLEIYGDYEPIKGHRDAATVKGLIGYTAKKLRAGAEVFLQDQGQGPSPAKAKRAVGVSVFGSVQSGARAWFFGRVDWADPSQLDGTDRTYLAIAGLDLQPAKDVHLIPNLYIVKYQKAGIDDDFIPRITFHYSF